MPQLRSLLAAPAILIALAAPLAHAQVLDTCKHPHNPHYAIDCGEALFSEDPLHLTFSSMPPGNGFALGLVLEQNSHYVSPFGLSETAHIVPGGNADPAQPDASTASLRRLGSLWSADGRLAAIASYPELAGKPEVTFPYETLACFCTKLPYTSPTQML